MKVRGNCPVCNPPKNMFVPSQEQIDATAPGGHLGYFPGKRCIVPEPCYHITSYECLQNLPSINDVVLIGNKTSAQLGLQSTMTAISNTTIDGMFKTYNGGRNNGVSGY